MFPRHRRAKQATLEAERQAQLKKKIDQQQKPNVGGGRVQNSKDVAGGVGNGAVSSGNAEANSGSSGESGESSWGPTNT